MIDRLARLRLFGEEDESGVSGDASVALAPKRTVTAAIRVCARAASKSLRLATAKTFVGEKLGTSAYDAFYSCAGKAEPFYFGACRFRLAGSRRRQPGRCKPIS